MSEARRLLEEEIKVVVAASKGAVNDADAYFRGRLNGLLWVRDRILAQPEPAAREAAKPEHDRKELRCSR
ncbi:hypothetical protein LCGC14_3168610, partial [marine sediment metagenome]